MSTAIQHIIESRSENNCQLTTGSSRARPTDNCQLTTGAIDRALQQAQDLVPDDFRAWHASMVRKLGVGRYLGLASDARRGRQPARLFSHLLKEAV